MRTKHNFNRDRRYFRETANRIKLINQTVDVPRGGIRL